MEEKTKLKTPIQKMSDFVFGGMQVVCAVALFIMTILMIIVVVGRYVFDFVPAWSEEFALFMMSWLAFFGSAIIEKDKDHIRVSVVDDYYPIVLLRIFSVIRYVIKLIFVVCMTYYGYILATTAKDMFASVRISRGWIYVPGAFAGLMMTFYLVINCKKELIDIWHENFGRGE